MAEPTLYLFDGYNLLHAGAFPDKRALRDALASFVATRGVRGILVFDGVGEGSVHGPLEVRYAPDADTLLERLAAEHRRTEQVCLVSSDLTVRGTSGQEVRGLGSADFLAGLDAPEHTERPRTELGDRLSDEMRARLERLRRGDD
jgi:predicted RNA-binding protein with PIN domain